MNALDTPELLPLPSTMCPTTPSRRRASLLNGNFLMFAAAGGLALATAGECSSVTHVPSLCYGALLWMWWAALAAVLWRLSRRAPAIASFNPRILAAHLAIAALLGAAHLLLLWASGFAWPGFSRESQETMWRYLLNVNRFGMELLLYGFIFAVVGVAQSHIRATREAMRSVELKRQLSAAQLQALQMQLEPHFLFNTLNAITTLVELDRGVQAAEMLGHLNTILKSTLQRSAPEKVPLSEELEIVRSYLAIEQVRFADRLHLYLDIDPGALDGLVPCFLLQPLVENAIRHGIAHCEEEGRIEASAAREGALLRLRVRDTGSGSTESSRFGGHGIGLKNTRDRLLHFYPDAHAIAAHSLQAGGFEVTITIPYEQVLP